MATGVAELRGEMNDWAGGTGLTDSDANQVYDITLKLEQGKTYAYKFYANEYEDYVNGGNRSYTVGTDAEQTLPVATFNKAYTDGCNVDKANYEVTFTADMSVARLKQSTFDPAEDVVTISGEINGWNTSADTLFQGFSNPDLYSNVVVWDNVELPAAGETRTIGYKFVIGQPSETAPNGYEGGDNRTFVITGNETDTDNNGYREIEVSPRYYNDVGPDQVFTEATTLTVEVDLRPALYFLKDNGRLPFDTQSGDPADTIDNLVIMGPAANAFDTLDPWPWGNVPTGRQLKDDGQNGDTMAGDSLYTISFDYAPGTGRTIIGKFGINGLDNEAVVQGDTYFDFGAAADNDGRVRIIFGAVRRRRPLTDQKGPSCLAAPAQSGLRSVHRHLERLADGDRRAARRRSHDGHRRPRPSRRWLHRERGAAQPVHGAGDVHLRAAAGAARDRARLRRDGPRRGDACGCLPGRFDVCRHLRRRRPRGRDVLLPGAVRHAGPDGPDGARPLTRHA